MFPKNKQNKLKQMKKDKILKEEVYLNYTPVIENAFCFFFFLNFSSDELTKYI